MVQSIAFWKAEIKENNDLSKVAFILQKFYTNFATKCALKLYFIYLAITFDVFGTHICFNQFCNIFGQVLQRLTK